MPAARTLTAFAVLLATVVLAGCSGDAGTTPPPTTVAAAPSTTAAAPSTTSTTLSAKAELLAAYNRSWETYADALRRLDASKLATTFAGNALKAAQDEVANQRPEISQSRSAFVIVPEFCESLPAKASSRTTTSITV